MRAPFANKGRQLEQALVPPKVRGATLDPKPEEKELQRFQAIVPREAKIALASANPLDPRHQLAQAEYPEEQRLMVPSCPSKQRLQNEGKQGRAPSIQESFKRRLNAESALNDYDGGDRNAGSLTPRGLDGYQGQLPDNGAPRPKNSPVVNKHTITRILENQRQSQEPTFQKSGSGSRSDSPTRRAGTYNRPDYSVTNSRELAATEKGIETQLLTQQMNSATGTGAARPSAEERHRQILIEVNNSHVSHESSVELSAADMLPTLKQSPRGDSNPFVSLFKDLQKQHVDLQRQQKSILN